MLLLKLKKIDKMKKIEDLHAGKKTVSRISRLHFLQELEEELKVYYLSYTETVDRPYSEQEQEIIVRIIKMLIRHLRGTSKFQLFSRRGTRRKSEDPDDVEEREEHRKEQTDEIRLRHTNLYSYNPLSKKYKARKEELLQNLKREF